MNVDYFIKNGIKPNIHGNGFIQVNMPFDQRLHIWPYPALSAQKVYTGIHNHTFCFESQVVLGETLNVVYDVFHTDRDGEYYIYEATPVSPLCPKCGKWPTHGVMTEGKTSKPTQDRCYCAFCNLTYDKTTNTELKLIDKPDCFIQRKYTQCLKAGDAYTFPAFEYHESVPLRMTVATVMKKTLKVPGFRARVLCPYHLKPDNDFNREKYDENLIWEIVDSVCRSVDLSLYYHKYSNPLLAD